MAHPAERILARCLAIAPIESLHQTLETLSKEGGPTGQKFAWFVTVFLQRIHGIDKELVLKTFARVLQEKKLQKPQGSLLADDQYHDAPAWLREIA